MKELIKDNRTYFIFLLSFAVLGGVYLFYLQKGDDILFFNVYRKPLPNYCFRFATKMGEPPVYLLFGIAGLFYKFRYSLLIALTGFIVLGVSFGLKTFFAMDRPVAFFDKLKRIAEVTLVEGVDIHSGPTSFPSGHTMSAFAIYSLLIFLLPKKTVIAVSLFLTALLVGISRVFLVQHFWEDVYAGALIGSALAIVIYLVQAQFKEQPARWFDRPVFTAGKKGNAA
ncbi:MAG: phosphatase PAP2 family protein [Saprospiraceae bacterium]